MNPASNRNGKGFTLIEVLMAVVLLALAISAIVFSNTAYTQAAAQASHLSTAQFLLEQIRELTATLPVLDPETGTDTFGPEEGTLALYDDVDDFDAEAFNPSIDSQRNQITGFSGYSQSVTVENVSPNSFEQVVADHSSDFVRITVKIYYDNSEILETNWIRSPD